VALSVYDLAVQGILYLIAFQRRVEEGETVSYEDTRAEMLTLLSDLDRQSHTEPGLWETWTKARVPLVYLADEVMILNCDWPYRQRWADECLEVKLLGHPEALGGENFYKACDEAIKELASAEQHGRQDVRARVEVLLVFYVALQTGFKGKYALDLNGLREYKSNIFTKLPAYAQTRAKELYPEADDHTVIMDPNYQPILPLIYVLIGGAIVLVLYFAATFGYWSQLIADLKKNKDETPIVEASGKLPIATSLPGLPAAGSAPASAAASRPGG
jgi:type IV/VI secretion system ImpK/VasF family protein